MNSGNSDTTQLGRASRSTTNLEELTRLKQELLQAEIRLAKARATVVSTEIDIKVINTRLREFMKGSGLQN